MTTWIKLLRISILFYFMVSINNSKFIVENKNILFWCALITKYDFPVRIVITDPSVDNTVTAIGSTVFNDWAAQFSKKYRIIFPTLDLIDRNFPVHWAISAHSCP